MTTYGIIADIGGTNARFALAPIKARKPGEALQLNESELVEAKTLNGADYENIDGAIQAYLDQLPEHITRPVHGVMAIACPTDEDQITMTNHTWAFKVSEIKAQLGFEFLQFINDYNALANSVPHLDEQGAVKIGPGEAVANMPMVVTGPGTGLGLGALVFDAQGWYGGDINKLVVKTEAEYSLDHSEFEEIQVQALWSHAISPYLDVQTGIRHDFEPDGLSHAVLGLEGMLPYRVDMDGAFFLSEEGDLTADVELEYELMLSQRLHLLPRAELAFSAQEIAELGTGEGLTNGQFGLRLAYDVVREFAPFVGVEWQGSFGETEDILRAAGERTEQTVFVIGFHAWY